MNFIRVASYALIASLASFPLYASIIGRPPSPAYVAAAGTDQERLTGATAVAHLEKLQTTQKRFASATREPEELGSTKADDVTVIQSVDLVRSRSAVGGSKFLLAQSSGAASGEIVFWSWDDGDPDKGGEA